MVRAYSWLTLMWGVVFLVRVAVQWVLYRADEVELLGTASLLLGLPVTAVEVVVTLWVVSRLHRHRAEAPQPGA
jgi:choline-glycine betaine transporter